jgi:hypothetical protein
MSGLYTRFNLSEEGLNSSEAVQKLYLPLINNDINLFAFSGKLSSSVFSTDQITGLVNEPISLVTGETLLRTKFLTNSFTFSNENTVWFESAPPLLDRRSSTDPGSPFRVSRNGPVVNVIAKSQGSGYSVVNSEGQQVAYPHTLDVFVIGKTSKSRNCLVRVTVNLSGGINPDLEVIQPGSGYLENEPLELVVSCSQGESPIPNQCQNYESGVILRHDSRLGFQAFLVNGKYPYRVKSSSGEGFFLYDDKSSEWLYLGDFYDSFKQVSPGIQLKRRDPFSADSLSNLYKLDGRSYFFEYSYSIRGSEYRASETLGEDLQNISDRIETIKSDFSSYIQNSRTPRLESEEGNNLGSRYNTLEGLNFTSNHRTVFRDPDKVLQEDDVDFTSLRLLSQENDVEIGGKVIPGIWINEGEGYRRVFGTDNKPFVSLLGRFYLSPRIYGLNSSNEAVEIDTFKYSVNTSYFNQSTETVLGFDTTVTTLIQNISPNPSNGGFVYYRNISGTILNSTTGVSSWPLFSYKDSTGAVKEISILSV